MKTARHVLVALFAVLIAQVASAEPTRESLLAAWEEHLRSLPATTSFEKTGDNTYRFADTDLPYDGELKVHGALVRSSESPGFDTEFTHLGMVEFGLTEMPEERLTSQVYYYWLADRQTLHYSATTEAWVDSTTYTDSFGDMYDLPSLGALSFMINYGIWILLAALVIFIFVGFGKQTKKARELMDETAAINQQARENLDRAEKMQNEVLAIARESRDLQAESNELLRQMLDGIRR